MNIASFTTDLNYGEQKPEIKVILETSFSKEIRILFKKGQLMKEHKAPFPIVVQVLSGAINFGVNGQLNLLEKGDIISLEANVPHDLTAQEDSMVRLTLSKKDSENRVNEAVNG